MLVELGLFYNYLGIDTTKLKNPAAQREEETGLALLAWHGTHEEVRCSGIGNHLITRSWARWKSGVGLRPLE